MNLQEEAARWVDNEDYARDIRDRFNQAVYSDIGLYAHREYTGPRGMGENSFHWMWKLLVDDLPDPFSFLEVGVFKGQILSLVRYLADKTGKSAAIYGVTLLSTFAGSRPPHPEGDYGAAIKEMHDHFKQVQPTLIVGDSTSEDVHNQVADLEMLDMVFVDGCHDYSYVSQDILFYGKRVKPGGFLVLDDAANNLKQPWGFFQGIADVTQAVVTLIETDPQWEHVITVCHDRIFRRAK